MRTLFIGLTLSAVVAFSVGSSAETKTVTGSLIDTKCHTKMGAKAFEADHRDCAATCAKNGAPLAVVTADGIYHVTGSFTADNNAKLVEFAGKKVQAKGEVTEQGDKMMIDLSLIQLAS